jgi:hypothetical protein
VKMAIYNGEAKLPDGNTSDALTGTAAKGTVGVITYTGSNAIAPASNTPFVPANEIGKVVATTPTPAPVAQTPTP